MDPIVKIDPEIMSGTPCFAGTRVPVKSLFDWLEGGYTVDYWLDQFPTVRREQVMALLEQSRYAAEATAERVAELTALSRCWTKTCRTRSATSSAATTATRPGTWAGTA